MRLPAAWPLYVCGCVVVLCFGMGLYGAFHHPRSTSSEAVLVAEIARAKVDAARDSLVHVVAKATTDRAVSTLHARIAAYQTVRATVVLHPLTRADTVQALAQLPALVKTADGVMAGSAGLETAASGERAASAALDADRVHAIAAQDTLIRQLAYRPRLSGTGAFLYDPIAKVPRIAVQIDLRTVGQWALGVRGEHRFLPGESPSALVVVSHPLF